MSGPIVRKYGFPNFEKIFGDGGAQQGTSDEAKPAEESAEKAGKDAKKAPAAKKSGGKKK